LAGDFPAYLIAPLQYRVSTFVSYDAIINSATETSFVNSHIRNR